MLILVLWMNWANGPLGSWFSSYDYAAVASIVLLNKYFLAFWFYITMEHKTILTPSFQLPAFVVQPKHSDTTRTAQNESYAWIDFQSSATLLLDYVECLSAPHENAAFTVNFLFPIFNHLLFMHFHTAQIWFQIMSHQNIL